MARPSLQRVAIGFSVMASTPAAAISITCCGCSPLGVASATQSGWLPASSAVSESKPWACVACTAAFRATGIGVAHRHQFGLAGMAVEGLDVVLGDAPAADQGKAQLAVDDGRAAGFHERGVRTANMRTQIIADAPHRRPATQRGPSTNA